MPSEAPLNPLYLALSPPHRSPWFNSAEYSLSTFGCTIGRKRMVRFPLAKPLPARLCAIPSKQKPEAIQISSAWPPLNPTLLLSHLFAMHSDFNPDFLSS